MVAVQGSVGPHLRMLRALDVEAVEVRGPGDLDALDGVVLPGGESTTISQLLERSGLFDALQDRLAAGMGALGTCAGLILLASDVRDGRADQRSLGALEVAVRRNAFGRQAQSFEAELPVAGLAGERFPGVFIRAPVVERVGEGVTVLAEVDGRPVACRQGAILATAFHPELSGDVRVHEAWLASLPPR